ncbi:transporter substrate-binding domain-containing protein [Thiocapsa imhoffii]|nr:transporter substrate-binding domain-containing protein [Thiocapsa imhoffii]
MLLCLILAVIVVPPAAASRLRIAVFGQDPPLSFIDYQGQLAGFDIDFAQALCRQIRFECELIPTEWEELLTGLVQRRVDAVVASISITDERREQVAFTRPYYDSPGRFVARRGRFTEFDPASLAGAQIGVARATTFDAYATDQLGERNTLYRYSTRRDALADLVLGRTDLVFGDHIALHENFLSTEAGAGFELIGPPVSDRAWFGDGIGVAVAKGDTALLALLDEAIAELNRNGVFELIRRGWFDYDIRNLSTTLQAQEDAHGAPLIPDPAS